MCIGNIVDNIADPEYSEQMSFRQQLRLSKRFYGSATKACHVERAMYEIASFKSTTNQDNNTNIPLTLASRPYHASSGLMLRWCRKKVVLSFHL